MNIDSDNTTPSRNSAYDSSAQQGKVANQGNPTGTVLPDDFQVAVDARFEIVAEQLLQCAQQQCRLAIKRYDQKRKLERRIILLVLGLQFVYIVSTQVIQRKLNQPSTFFNSPQVLEDSKAIVRPSPALPPAPASALSEARDGAALAELMQRIIGQESAGDPGAINPDSGALGLGQVMPENLPTWSREAIGREVSVQEFLEYPELQKQIIHFKLNQYWQAAIVKTSDPTVACRRVASTWYSGNPSLYNDMTPQVFNGGSYPSIADYTTSVCAGFEISLKVP